MACPFGCTGEGRACGDDGCGGSCGTCAEGPQGFDLHCEDDGTCVPKIKDKPRTHLPGCLAFPPGKARARGYLPAP